MIFLENSTYNTADILSMKQNILNNLSEALIEQRISNSLVMHENGLRELETELVQAFLDGNISSVFFENHFLGFLFYIGQVFINRTPNTNWIVKIEKGEKKNIFIPTIQYDDKYELSEFIGVLFDVTYDLDFPFIPEIGNAYGRLSSEYLELTS